jgi:hypothetical protein
MMAGDTGSYGGLGVTGKVNCLAPGCNGFHAPFQWEMKCSATSPSLAKSAAVFEPQRGEITKPRLKAWVNGTPVNPEP